VLGALPLSQARVGGGLPVRQAPGAVVWRAR